MIYPSSQIYMVGDGDTKTCAVGIRWIDEIIVGVRMSGCCIYKEDFCIAEKRDVTIRLQDRPTEDYSTVSEAYFTVYSDQGLTTQTFRKTLTGGGMTIPTDYELSIDLSVTDTTLTPGVFYWQADIETVGGSVLAIGQGRMTVRNTGDI